MSKIVRPKTPFERCAYPALKEALEKTNYTQTEKAASALKGKLLTWRQRGWLWLRLMVRLLLALEDLTGMTFRELFGECEGRR